LARKTQLFHLTYQPFLPRKRLLAGRFRPALRFATRGPAPRFKGWTCRHRELPGAQEGASPQIPAIRTPSQSRWLCNKEDAMTKRSEAKYKIDRRMGQNIWGRPKSPVNKREYGPGQHGQRRKGKLSDFGVQLRAKQKLKGYYANISERQFHGIYVEAGRMKGDTGENLIGLLERRLDTVVYRAKFVATMFAARQFINHGHVKVNGRRVNISSFKVKVGDVVEVKESSKQLTVVLEANQLAERDVPDFLEVDHGKMTAKFNRIPHLSDVPFAVQMEPHLIVEFYSR
jgi:small subunit ribosomal protein S4